MAAFEYKVVPAPRQGEKARGVKTTADRFALTLTTLMNALGRDGWEYLRADTLPCEERVGFTGKQTAFQNMLVFRRALAAPAVAAPAPAPAVQPTFTSHRALVLDTPVPPAPPVAWPESPGAPPVGPARPLAAE